MNNQTTRIWTTLRYLALIPLIALGVLSILASGSSGGGDTPALTASSDTGLFDDFSAGTIDRTKWANLEFVRQVHNGVLESALTRFGSNGSNNLNLIDPDAVSAIQADVTVTAVRNTNAVPRARLAGFWYNDGTGTPGTGAIGDVFADINIRHDGTQLVVNFQVFLCGDFGCFGGTTLLFDSMTFGPVAVGETHTLSLAYDGGAVFTFGFDGNTVSFDTPVPFAGPPERSERLRKRIGTRVTGIAGPDEGAFIAATFDNVMVNGNPYDDFSAAMIDRTKWADLEFVRRVNNGVLELALTRFGSNGSSRLSFINPAAVSAIQADVTVTAVSNTNAAPRARVAGFFYNDGTGTPGSGAIGEVFAGTEIRHDGTQLVVALRVFLCGNFNCSGGTTILFDTTTFGPVAVGETHTLSVAWDGGTVFTYGFDGSTVSFDTPIPVAGPSQSPFKAIGTRVTGIAGPDEGAFIAATFDNVVVTQPPPPPSPASLLVASGFSDAVPRYDAITGAFLGDFVPAGSGGLDSPRGLAIGPDGNLYVAAGVTADAVLRYDGGTGAFIDAFVTGLDPFGIVFGPDGNLYVSELSSAEVLRFNGTTGVFIDTFVPAGSGGLGFPRDLLFGPDGNLYVSSAGSNEVLRYNGTTGAFIDVFASGVDARGLVFGPDGNLYVASFAGDEVKRYDGTTGTFIDTFVTAGSGGLDAPRLMLFVS